MAAGQEPATFSPARLTAYSDSFAIVIQGVGRGWHRYELRRDGQGFAFVDQFEIAGLMHRKVEVVLAPDLTVRHARSSGEQFGNVIGAELQYADRHVTGWSLQTGTNPASAPRRVEIDTILPSRAFEGFALMALVPTLKLSVGSVYVLTLFDADEGTITSQTLRVVGEEDVAVPAGTFRALRLDLTTTQAPVRLWYTTHEPHRLVKIGGETDAYVTVLVKQNP